MSDKFDYLKAPARFFSAFPDVEIFNFEGDNLAKLFLGEYFSSQFASSVPAWNPQRSSRSITGIIKNLVRLFRGLGFLAAGLFSPASHMEFLFFGSNGRTIARDGKNCDIYNYHIVKALGRRNCLIIDPIDGGGRKIFQPDFFLHDFVILRLAYQVCARRRVRFFVKKLMASARDQIFREGEAEQILAKFLANKWIFTFILKTFRIKKALVICHYGKESFTSACKSLHIPVVELMHGLILPSSPNYCDAEISRVYRDAIRSSQLPDRLGVFGPLWKEILEPVGYFNSDELFVVGYYLKSSLLEEGRQSSQTPWKDDSTKFSHGKKKILITTEPIYQEEIIRYINFLKAKLDRSAWMILIKPHPAEKKEAYSALDDPGFIETSTQSVYNLLPEASIVIGISSSVLFEAVFYPVSIYLLYVPGQKRILDEILATGIARKLEMTEMPFGYTSDAALRKRVFSDFDSSALMKAFELSEPEKSPE